MDRGDGTLRPPGFSDRGQPLSGNLAQAFQRLANWRTSQGVQSRVVTITDIITGVYGDFTEQGFARDLQEVLRNFLKHAHQTWDTRFAVLGGDVNIVPIRKLIGIGPNTVDEAVGVLRAGNNPPDQKQCFVLSGKGAVKLHPRSDLCKPTSASILCSHHGGVRYPYNREAGPGNPGWYFTTEDDFNNLSEGFTRLETSSPGEFIIFEGPESVIDDDFYWILDANQIPSDFYYASLFGPHYGLPGKHDFDFNNNGLYGQSHLQPTTNTEESLDRVQFHADMWVGRVPARTEAEVNAFIDKVVTYEGLRAPEQDYASIDTSYLRKVLFAADYWVRSYNKEQADDTKPPATGTFTHKAGTSTTALRTELPIQLVKSAPDFRLVADDGSGMQSVIPYDTKAGPTQLGWYFCTDNTFKKSTSTPTNFVLVSGPEADITPDHFFWDPTGLERAADEKEDLRAVMAFMYPQFEEVERHYSDYFELKAPPTITQLKGADLQAALNSGQHFVSLTGHGGPSGCCRINAGMKFKNQTAYYIAYADSCLTARPDTVGISLGEAMILAPGGGAVAYLGYARMGFVGLGDNYEAVFWCMLSGGGRLGPAAGLRVATEDVRDTWMRYTMMLYGDPAMRVWHQVPQKLGVNHKESFQETEAFLVDVHLEDEPLVNARVTLTAGSGLEGLFLSKRTGPSGRARFTLPADTEGLDELVVTVWSRAGQLYQAAVQK